jgi:hypothetical protein
MSKAISIKDIIAWCDKQVEEGKTLELCWEGGGDSGWVFFEVDQQSADGEEISALVDMMYNELDYGSWAGEFSANGRAEYNSVTKSFDGIDYYSEDEWETKRLEEPIQVLIPKSLGFDSIEYNIEGDASDEVRVEITFNIINGFIRPELHLLQEEMSKEIKEKLGNIFENIDVNYFNTHVLVERHEMNMQNDNVVFQISHVGYSTWNSQENTIYLDLQERLENEEENE